MLEQSSMKLNKDTELSPDSPVYTAKLTLFHFPFASECFPNDPNGVHSFIFKNKQYIFGSYPMRWSEYLQALVNSSDPKTNKSYDVKLEFGKSEQAFDLCMKILSGFKEVEIDFHEITQVYIILQELSNDFSI